MFEKLGEETEPSPVQHNRTLVKDLLEVVGQYDSGLLTDVELLGKAVEIGCKMVWPDKGDVDQNTGLTYGVEGTPEKKAAVAKQRDSEAAMGEFRVHPNCPNKDAPMCSWCNCEVKKEVA